VLLRKVMNEEIELPPCPKALVTVNAMPRFMWPEMQAFARDAVRLHMDKVDAWRWVGDGSDDLASMSHDMKVLITAREIRRLIAWNGTITHSTSELAEAVKHWFAESDGIMVSIPVELARAIYVELNFPTQSTQQPDAGEPMDNLRGTCSPSLEQENGVKTHEKSVGSCNGSACPESPDSASTSRCDAVRASSFESCARLRDSGKCSEELTAGAAFRGAVLASPQVAQTAEGEQSIKDVYVRVFGSDTGWLDVQGSYFITGYQAAGMATPPHSPIADSVDSQVKFESWYFSDSRKSFVAKDDALEVWQAAIAAQSKDSGVGE
jgi:hypothetical protein